MLMEGILEAGTLGMLQGHNGPDNQTAECLFFSLQGVWGDKTLQLADVS